jgi:hypothetical protein
VNTILAYLLTNNDLFLILNTTESPAPTISIEPTARPSIDGTRLTLNIPFFAFYTIGIDVEFIQFDAIQDAAVFTDHFLQVITGTIGGFIPPFEPAAAGLTGKIELDSSLMEAMMEAELAGRSDVQSGFELTFDLRNITTILNSFRVDPSATIVLARSGSAKVTLQYTTTVDLLLKGPAPSECAFFRAIEFALESPIYLNRLLAQSAGSVFASTKIVEVDGSSCDLPTPAPSVPPSSEPSSKRTS